jgi:hypothetical protein
MKRAVPMRQRRLLLRSLAALLICLGCKSAGDRACADQFARAQAIVLQIDAEDLASVSGSVAAVDEAIQTCRTAGRHGDVDELDKARTQLSQHRDRLLRRQEMLERRTEVSPEELARLIKEGDPRCPRGQGYLHAKSGKRIVCVGPQPVDMSRAQAEEYFKARGYKLSANRDGSELRFEYGSELVVFAYAGDGAAAPRCVTLYPPPDRSWQEVTARLTGVAPARLKPNQPIRRSSGPLPFAVEESAQKVVARLGSCG